MIGERLERLTMAGSLLEIVRVEEDIADSVVPGVRKLTADVSLSLAHKEAMGDASHNTSTVTVSGVSSGSASVSHGT